MSEVKASDVKALRDRTGAGMMDCKKALVECSGNIEEAIDWLRKKGLAAAAKKAGRVAAEGLVGVFASGNTGSVIEINAETDFVARNDLFQKYVSDVAEIANKAGCDIENLKSINYPSTSHSVSDELTNLIAVIGENMTLRRLTHISVKNGVIASYIHNKTSPSLGKIGILVAIESDGSDKSELAELGRQVAMHIAATRPQSTSIDDLDPALVERERNVLIEQAKASGKPAEVIDKMVEGRIKKFYEESVLLEQVFVIDGESRVKDIVEKTAKKIGSPVKIIGFVRYELGEGIEKQAVDFAAEVAAQLS